MHGTIDCMLCSARPAVRPELEFVTYTAAEFDWIGRNFFHYRAKRLAGKTVSEITCFVSSGTLNLAPSILPSRSGQGHWVTHADIKGSRGRWTHPVSAIVAVSVVSSGVFIQAALGSMVKNRRKSNEAN